MSLDTVAGLIIVIAILFGIILLGRKFDSDAKAYIEQWAKTKNYTVVSIYNRKFQINLSVPLVLEYESVAERHRLEFGLTKLDLEEIIGFLCEIGAKREIHYLWRPYLSDPKDDMVLEVAVAGQCEYIVTHNVKDFKGSEDFGIKAILPREFLLKIRG